MHESAGPPPDPGASWGRELDERAAPGPQAPVRGRAPMAQHGARAGGEDDGERPALPTQFRVAQRVDPAVKADEATACEPMVDRILPEPERRQLPPRHYAVLARRQLLHLDLDRT